MLQIFKEAQDLLPGGVNSPVRAFKSVGGQPIVFDRVKASAVHQTLSPLDEGQLASCFPWQRAPDSTLAQGAYCWDVDGNKYIDYVGSWGPAIVGHAHDEVNAALKQQIDKGTSFGAPCELEASP